MEFLSLSSFSTSSGVSVLYLFFLFFFYFFVFRYSPSAATRWSTRENKYRNNTRNSAIAAHSFVLDIGSPSPSSSFFRFRECTTAAEEVLAVAAAASRSLCVLSLSLCLSLCSNLIHGSWFPTVVSLLCVNHCVDSAG